jgi:hypothetical protein
LYLKSVSICFFKEELLWKLICGGLVREVSSAPHVVNPLTVAVNGKGKERLILDLRHVNKQVVQNKIKFEDWKTAKQYMQINSFGFIFDPLTATVNGFTTCGALDTSRTRPPQINSKIVFSTKMVCAYADLLLFKNTDFKQQNNTCKLIVSVLFLILSLVIIK